MNVTQYAIEDGDGNAVVSAVFDDDEYDEAREVACRASAVVVAYEYEPSDWYVVDDFRASDAVEEDD